jgi:hypothetical protein
MTRRSQVANLCDLRVEAEVRVRQIGESSASSRDFLAFNFEQTIFP